MSTDFYPLTDTWVLLYTTPGPHPGTLVVSKPISAGDASVIATSLVVPTSGVYGLRMRNGSETVRLHLGEYLGDAPPGSIHVDLPTAPVTLALNYDDTTKAVTASYSLDGLTWTVQDAVAMAAPPTFGDLYFDQFSTFESISASFQNFRVLAGTTALPYPEKHVFFNPIGGDDLIQPPALTATQEAVIHALVGAQFGDLEFDVGRSVRWTQYFVDDVFITDVNYGDPRYWIIDWAKTFPYVNYQTAGGGVSFFDDPVAFRKRQFADADKFAFDHEEALVFDNDDWVLWIDAHEGLSVDNTPPFPDDYDFDLFRSYVAREIRVAVEAGKDRIMVPFFVYVRHDDIQNVEYDWIPNQPEGGNKCVQSMGVPYYLPYQGLLRLMKVSALRNPSFDWASIDQPSTLATPVLADPGYFLDTANTGSFIVISRPSALSSLATMQWTIKVRLDECLPADSALSGFIAGIFPMRINADGRMIMSIWSVEGQNLQLIGNAASVNAAPIVVGQDIWLRGKLTMATALCEYWSSADGQTWNDLGSAIGTNAGLTPLLTNSYQVMVGGVTQSGATFPGRIYEFAEQVNGVDAIHFVADQDLKNWTPGTTTFTTTCGRTAFIYGGMHPSTRVGFYPPACTYGGGQLNSSGVASTPDPGPLPNEFVLVAEGVVPLIAPHYGQTLASQYNGDPQRSWSWRRGMTNQSHLFTVAPTGTSAGATTRTISNVAPNPAPGTTERFALAVQLNNGSSQTVFTPLQSLDNGATWVADGSPYTIAMLLPFDSTEILRIGGWVSYEIWQGLVHFVEARTGLNPAVGGTTTWTPGYITMPNVSGNNIITANAVIPTDAAGTMRVECEYSPTDGNVHTVVSGLPFLLYAPYTNGWIYGYFYDQAAATARAVTANTTMIAAAGIPTGSKWQFKIDWNPTTDTLSLFHRAPGPDLLDETGWLSLSTAPYAGMTMVEGSRNQSVGATTQNPQGRVWRAVMTINGVATTDFDFRYLRSDPGTSMVLRTGQTASVSRAAVSPMVFTQVVDGVLWRCDSTEVSLAPRINRLTNADTNGDGIADGWEVYSGTNVNNKSLTFQDGYQRIVGAPTVVNAIYGVQASLPYDSPVVPGQGYAFEAIFRISGATPRAGAVFFTYWCDVANTMGATVNSPSFRTNSPTEWVRALWFGIAPATAVSVRQMARIQGYAGANGNETVTFEVQRISVIPLNYTDPRGRVWTLSHPDVLLPAGRDDGSDVHVPTWVSDVRVQAVSYGYAHWNLQDIPPGATGVPALNAENDMGWRQRNLLSKMRPVPGLPYGDTWQFPDADVPGFAGPWAPDTFENQVTGVVIPEERPPIDLRVAGVRVPLYDSVLRLNTRDGVWYSGDGQGNVPLEWDDESQSWKPPVPSEQQVT